MNICLDCAYLKKQIGAHSWICTSSKSPLFNVPYPHKQKKTRRGCKRYKERAGLYVDMSQIKGMKFIEDYRGKFQGSDIWVLGCDPNLDFYPDDFFDDKVSITLNWACVAFPNSTYFTGDHIPDHRVTSRFPGCLKKYIIPTFGKKGRKPLPWDVCGLDPIYMRYLTRKDALEQTKADFEKMAEQAFSDGPFESIIGMTSACMGTQEAAVLGAKRIILVGCSMTMGDAQKRGMSEFYANPSHPSAEYRVGQHKHQIRARQSIARFAEIFKGYGVEVVRHRFNEKEGKFVFQEVKSERKDLWDISYGGGR